MNQPTKYISVLEASKGAILKQVEVEVQKVLENIKDIKTDPKKPRTITVQLVFKADENRQVIELKAQASSKLQQPLSTTTTLIANQVKAPNGQMVNVLEEVVQPSIIDQMNGRITPTRNVIGLGSSLDKEEVIDAVVETKEIKEEELL